MKFNPKTLNINIKKADNFLLRLKGFMFKNDKITYGLLFDNCNSIHTFFMLQTIDVIMTDEKNNILYCYQNLKPFKIIWPKKNVKKVYELPNGIIKMIKK
jgi:uncharacterized protein